MQVLTLMKDIKVIPEVNDTDSIDCRIETLRVYLEIQLGDILFLAAYKCLTDLKGEDDDSAIDRILGSSKSQFVPLIKELIVCEDSYYKNINDGH